MRFGRHSLWAYGHRRLQEKAQELKDMGIDFIDFTYIFKNRIESTHADLIHMNDIGQDIFSEKLADEIIARLENEREAY